LPALSRVAYAEIASGSQFSWGVRFDGANALGVEIFPIGVETLDDFAPFFKAARQGGAEAALIPDFPRLNPRLKRIGMEASQHGMPAIGYRRDFAEGGGLLSYGPLLSESTLRLALQIDKILRGAHPGDLPVERQTRFEFVINLREAKALGVSIPRLVRLRADELIQ
ncbi:MAG: ABC transporter substrate binding protein, partial [Vicinamibacterales bacterium]